jgi:hypothetical protein
MPRGSTRSSRCAKKYKLERFVVIEPNYNKKHHQLDTGPCADVCETAHFALAAPSQMAQRHRTILGISTNYPIFGENT